jgi:serine/threonine-protein kinase
MSPQERAFRSRLAKLVHEEPLLHGTLNPRSVTCGNPGCRCARGERVALKPLRLCSGGAPDAVKLFLREMRLSARLRHPNIVSVLALGDAGGDLWIATELVPGENAAALRRRGLGLRDAVDIVCQVLDALGYAHGLNLVHRDVKPPNILVTGQPGAYRAKLADFGLAKSLDEAGLSGITRRGETRGTVPFMPPEQVIDCRLAKPAGDLYQAGATLYWLLTGQYVYDFEKRGPRGEPRDPFLVILEDPIVPVRDRDATIPEAMARAIETALRREPEKRFETAAAMASALRRSLA